MQTRGGIRQLLFGADRKLHRLLQYWAATVAMYAVVMGLIFGRAALAGQPDALALCLYTIIGIGAFYVLVRTSGPLGLSPNTLAGLQAVFSISIQVWGYPLAGPLRGPTLMGLMVVIVFSTFALRPRQTLLLTAVGLLGIGGTMWWHAAHDPLHFPPMVESVTFTIMAVSSLAVTFLTGEMSKLRSRLKTQKQELQTALDTIRTLATIDELTALANRRHMNALLAAEERRDPASGKPTCIALLDIDLFKQINDRHGHAAGDDVLRQFAAAARAEVRVSDVLARWGGEEFLLMLPDTLPEEALAVLARLRTRVAAIRVEGVSLERPVSFSAGLTPRLGRERLTATINRADEALYRAKAEGRDRVLEA